MFGESRMNNQDITLQLAKLFSEFAENYTGENLTASFFTIINTAMYLADSKSEAFKKINNDEILIHCMNGLRNIPDKVFFEELKRRIRISPEVSLYLFEKEQ